LQISAGGVHDAGGGIAHDVVQVPVPIVPHDVVHATLAPRTQAKPLSGPLTQSSSTPLQTSAGGAHDAPVGIVQDGVQLPVPADPQVVVHGTTALCTQAKRLSGPPTQSSSRPLHVSAGGVHDAPVGRAHAAVHVPVPAEPQVVAHDTLAPWTQG
jgi:hypothetical protein